MRFLKLIKAIPPQLIILLLVAVLAATNYRVGTVLSGWDNLHPEFGFGFNIKRSIYAVWQEYQGVGLLGGMGHAADLIRQIPLYLISFIFPTEIIRYLFHFLMLLIGTLGLYYFLFFLIPKNHVMRKWGALSGSLFYLFNLVTVQMFNVPFEPYSVHYAFLPWLLFLTIRYLRLPSLKNYLYLVFINFLAVPHSYIGTFFLVYILALSILTIQFLNKKNFGRIAVLYLTVFIINAFWLLPNVYFIYKKVNVNTQAKINRMSTQDMFLRNKKFGDLANVLLLKGFWFDNTEINSAGNLEYQLQDWLDYFKDPGVQMTGFVFPILAIFGCYYAFKEKNRNSLLLLPLLIFSFSILANNAPFFIYLAEIFYKIPLFSQVFRFPFTKLSILHLTSLAVFYGLGSLWLSEKILPYRKINLLLILFIILPLFYCLPVFSGKLFYYKVRAEIPREYFELFEYFRDKPSSDRIANFPQYTFWGWTFYRFNYSGSGFIWYGLEQPVLDRAFDVWSRENENYFNEISYAIYSRNLSLFEKVLKKYQIKWVLFDGNVISFSNSRELYKDRLETLISSSSIIKPVRSFGPISLYQVETTGDNVRLSNMLPVVSPGYISGNLDKAYLETGDYINSSGNRTETDRIHFPFRALFSDTPGGRHEFGISEDEDKYIFKTIIPSEFRNQKFIIPKSEPADFLEIDRNDLAKTVNKFPSIFLDGKLIAEIKGNQETSFLLPPYFNGNLEVKIPKIKGYYYFDSYDSDAISLINPFTCEKPDPERNSYERIIEFEKPFLRTSSIDGIYCLNYEMNNLTHQFGYLIRAESRNISGKSLYLGVINGNSKRSDLEIYLPRKNKMIPDDFDISYLIVPPMENYALGYLMNIRNISIGRSETVNDIGRISVNPIPYKFLTGLKLVKDEVDPLIFENINLSVSHPYPAKYIVEVDKIPEQQSTLILSQSYDKGWKLFAVEQNFQNSDFLSFIMPSKNGIEIKNHFKVNNWENGWILDGSKLSGKKLLVLYLPQRWQIFGMTLWILLPLLIYFHHVFRRSKESS